MSDVYIMTTIIDRKNSKKYIDLYKKDKLEVMYITLGEGTARGDILDYLGLEASEKMVIFNFVQQHDWMLTKKDLQRKLQIDAPGEGIAFLVPLSSIGGKRTLQFLLDRQELPESEESTLKDTTYELIVAIADQENLEMVMDAARGAGAWNGDSCEGNRHGICGKVSGCDNCRRKGHDLYCNQKGSEEQHYEGDYGAGRNADSCKDDCIFASGYRYSRSASC